MNSMLNILSSYKAKNLLIPLMNISVLSSYSAHGVTVDYKYATYYLFGSMRQSKRAYVRCGPGEL